MDDIALATLCLERAAERGLGTTIEVVLGKGFPAVAELPNRTGTEPLPSLTPSPSTSASIDTRAADEDICS